MEESALVEVTTVEGKACARALILSADASPSARALRVLEGLGACERPGVSRQRLVEPVSECTGEIPANPKVDRVAR